MPMLKWEPLKAQDVMLLPRQDREARIKFKECRRKESPSEDPWGMRIDRLAKLENLSQRRGGRLLRNKAQNRPLASTQKDFLHTCAPVCTYERKGF